MDAVVIGAGFGGLGVALGLVERGLTVTLVEQLRYPGGCASTFTRGGDRFESGATLMAGFAPGQLFCRLIERHGLDVRTHVIDPIVELRCDEVIAVPSTRAALVERLCALPGAPREALHRFFARQARVADALWPLFDDETLLPPFDLRALFRHAARLGDYVHVLPLLGHALESVMERDGVATFAPLRTFVDAVCQITVQCPAREAEAPLALSALDYFFRGARHVEGGVGALAWSLLGLLEQRGVEVRTSCAAKAIRREGRGFVVETRRGPIEARAVAANLVPRALKTLAPDVQLGALERRVQESWGAQMRYLVVDGPSRQEAHHLELVDDPASPFIDGNHLFCSISDAGEARTKDGLRTITISTHVRAPGDAAQAERVDAAIDRTLARRAPELVAATRRSLTASPRTFERFVGRSDGLVGGAPRRAGLHNYRGLSPRPVAPGLWLVGDSVFPGQSTLACALGGLRTAHALGKSLR